MRIDTPSKITTISIVTKKFSGVNAVSNLSFSVEENIFTNCASPREALIKIVLEYIV